MKEAKVVSKLIARLFIKIILKSHNLIIILIIKFTKNLSLSLKNEKTELFLKLLKTYFFKKFEV
jgi:hypothetical protein